MIAKITPSYVDDARKYNSMPHEQIADSFPEQIFALNPDFLKSLIAL